jgi:membrane associated rhomboid family serine protease
LLLAVHVVGGLFGWWNGFEDLGEALIFDRSARLRVAMGGQSASMVYEGDAWRQWTSVLVHTDATHLLTNTVAIYALGRLLEPMLGARRTWAWFWAGGAFGSYASLMAGIPRSDGASGGAYALLGAALVLGWSLRKELEPGDARLVGPVLWFFTVLNLGISLALPFVDAVAHGAGFAIGVGLALLFGRRRWWPIAWAETLWLAMCLVIVVGGWLWPDVARKWWWRDWLRDQTWYTGQ